MEIVSVATIMEYQRNGSRKERWRKEEKELGQNILLEPDFQP